MELKTGARLPNGSLVPIQDEEGVLPTGVTVIPVFTGFVLPAAVPPGIYAIEAEILDATLGGTISEDSAALISGAVSPRVARVAQRRQERRCCLGSS